MTYNRSYRSTCRNSIIPAICRPRSVVLIALIFCWSCRNETNAESRLNLKNLRLRAPLKHGLEVRQRSDSKPLGPAVLQPTESSEESNAVGPFVGNDFDFGEEGPPLLPPKNKKDCGGMPSIATRGLVGPTMKRSYFASTREELEKKLRVQNGREKREVKRSENNEPALPWECTTTFAWNDMGSDYYPRFVRTAECKSRSCFNGFFRCRPRRYKTKVLKRVSPSDSTSCEEDDVSLPESLRSQWRFVTVTITLCCDCVGRMPGNVET